jgi:hypothetical protein
MGLVRLCWPEPCSCVNMPSFDMTSFGALPRDKKTTEPRSSLTGIPQVMTFEQQLSGGLPVVGTMCHNPGLLASWLLRELGAKCGLSKGRAHDKRHHTLGATIMGSDKTQVTASLAISTSLLCRYAGLLHCPCTRVSSFWPVHRDRSTCQYACASAEACTSAAACTCQHRLLSMQP